MVILFMALYYGFAGILADLALGVYFVLLLAILTGLHATLTLPGIAALILSVGMAVDANVIIFEKVKEELRAGKALRSAINTGWSRAFVTIIDSNVTTLLAAVVLFAMGSGPIRGFAVTLTVGIVAHMFSAISVTRTFVEAASEMGGQRMLLRLGSGGRAAVERA
jgi:protein-export membrane protein SecD